MVEKEGQEIINNIRGYGALEYPHKIRRGITGGTFRPLEPLQGECVGV